MLQDWCNYHHLSWDVGLRTHLISYIIMCKMYIAHNSIG
jgi:hypothetical protein